MDTQFYICKPAALSIRSALSCQNAFKRAVVLSTGSSDQNLASASHPPIEMDDILIQHSDATA